MPVDCEKYRYMYQYYQTGMSIGIDIGIGIHRAHEVMILVKFFLRYE